MNFTFDNTGKIIINISENEITQFDSIKKQLSNELNNFIEYEREDLYIEISTFISNNAIKNKLANLKYHIINDLDYNESFKDVVYFNNGFIEFTNNDLFYQFASAYQIISDTSNAQRVLRNILKVQLIDWLIENDFKEDNSKQFVYNIPIDLTTLNNITFNNKIFKTPYAENLFYYIIKHTTTINTRKNIGAFYSWFCKSLNCSKYDFALFWNELKQPYQIKINSKSSASLDNKDTAEMNDELNNLKSNFDKINTPT
ncbi:hypothetical protein [Bizionia sp.]|uniref:hypothetical protein n=1 Tax=Bizionia sp. TaxID=1954480 RepID=UPI003A91B0E9